MIGGRYSLNFLGTFRDQLPRFQEQARPFARLA
jgi:hypothetical protein